ncbi:MAG: hypothetical protein ACK42D_01010 [Candidatus Paceibacteria bacterium]
MRTQIVIIIGSICIIATVFFLYIYAGMYYAQEQRTGVVTEETIEDTNTNEEDLQRALLDAVPAMSEESREEMLLLLEVEASDEDV